MALAHNTREADGSQERLKTDTLLVIVGLLYKRLG